MAFKMPPLRFEGLQFNDHLTDFNPAGFRALPQGNLEASLARSKQFTKHTT